MRVHTQRRKMLVSPAAVKVWLKDHHHSCGARSASVRNWFCSLTHFFSTRDSWGTLRLPCMRSRQQPWHVTRCLGVGPISTTSLRRSLNKLRGRTVGVGGGRGVL